MYIIKKWNKINHPEISNCLAIEFLELETLEEVLNHQTSEDWEFIDKMQFFKLEPITAELTEQNTFYINPECDLDESCMRIESRSPLDEIDQLKLEMRELKMYKWINEAPCEEMVNVRPLS